MSFLAKLNVDGQEFNVIDCSYNFEQSVDRNNKPSGAPRGGQIKVVIESRGTTDFLKWMVAHKLSKDGLIKFYKRDAMSKLMDLKFKKAYCIGYSEHFNAESSIPMQIELTISAKEIDVEGVTFQNTWVVE